MGDCDSEVSVGSTFSDSSRTTSAFNGEERLGRITTTNKGRRIALYNAMKLWQLEPNERWCCRYHAAAFALHCSAKAVQKHKCLPSFRAVAGPQCLRCGTLVDLATVGDSESLKCAICRSKRFHQGVIMPL